MFDILGRTLEMFGLVFVSDGQNEGPLTMALIFIAQLALLLCGIISVCYTCACVCEKLYFCSGMCEVCFVIDMEEMFGTYDIYRY